MALPNLLAPHGVIQPLEIDQILMTSGFHDPAPLQNEDLVRMKNRRETMRYKDRDQVLAHRNVSNRLADFLFGQRIQRRRRFVENQKVRPAQERASNRKPLLLPTGDFYPALTNNGIQPLVRSRKKTLARRLFQHGHALLVRGTGIHEEEILSDRAREELRVLSDQANALAQPVEIDLFNREPVITNIAALRPVEPHEQFDEGGFSGARGPDKRNRLAHRCGERN